MQLLGIELCKKFNVKSSVGQRKNNVHLNWTIFLMANRQYDNIILHNSINFTTIAFGHTQHKLYLCWGNSKPQWSLNSNRSPKQISKFKKDEFWHTFPHRLIKPWENLIFSNFKAIFDSKEGLYWAEWSAQLIVSLGSLALLPIGKSIFLNPSFFPTWDQIWFTLACSRPYFDHQRGIGVCWYAQ